VVRVRAQEHRGVVAEPRGDVVDPLTLVEEQTRVTIAPGPSTTAGAGALSWHTFCTEETDGAGFASMTGALEARRPVQT
jgi:hypothetical protein